MSATADRLGRAFAALADPTRRAAVERLRRAPMRAGDLAGALDVSPPALSRHLRVLEDADLVEAVADDADARARVFRLRRAPFRRLRSWLDDVEALWTDQLAAFAAHLGRRDGPARQRRR